MKGRGKETAAWAGKRIGITVMTMFLVSVMAFSAFAIIPGDAALLSLDLNATPEQIAQARAEMGLDRSLPEQYLAWLAKFFTGNLGNSSRFRGASIAGMILERLPVTCALAVFSLILITAISLSASILTVKKEGGAVDRIVSALVALNISFPGFFLGVLFVWIFGIIMKLFVPGAYIDYRDSVSGFLAYLFFPALVIAIPNAAVVTKFLRASLFHELSADYVRTARSKGNSRARILRVHVLKNAIIPAITLFGMITGEVFAGSIVVEQVFMIPGIGRLLLTSIGARDYATVQTLAIYISFVVILANTTADIAIRIIDPRIRRGAEQ